MADLYTILADLSGWNGGLIWFKSGVPGPIPDMEAWTAKFHNFHGESVVTRASHVKIAQWNDVKPCWGHFEEVCSERVCRILRQKRRR